MIAHTGICYLESTHNAVLALIQIMVVLHIRYNVWKPFGKGD